MLSLFPTLRFGGDYSPEQWPDDVRADDVRLMKVAGVTTATVAVFAWAKLEPEPGSYRFGWLDAVLDDLHAGGVRVILATATASPPAWMAHRHPESLPVTKDGVRLGFGSRQQYSPSSAVYREHALALVRQMALRYGSHPALEAWHTGNEYGCHVPSSYDEESAEAFRRWLEARYGTVQELNRAWGTDFWSQAYGSFAEVDVPRAAPTFSNPTQLLDFDRFSSDALLDLHRAEVDVLRSLSPGVPITTNFMGMFRPADYWTWAEHVDFVSDDSYPDPADPQAYVLASATRSLMRSLGGGQPWLLMEQAPSAVNWRRRNLAKPAGMHRVHSLQAVAHGADGVLHFQWRQSKAGAEKFHSALVPHAGEDSRTFREATALGAELAELEEVRGAPVPSRVAIVFDWTSWWALDQPATPYSLDYPAQVLDWYGAFLRRGVVVDFVRAGAATDGYDVVIAPALHVAGPAVLDQLAAVPLRGGHLVVGHHSAVLDEDLHVHLGGYLGGRAGVLQRTLGVFVEEFCPVAEGSSVGVVGELNGDLVDGQEVLHVRDAEVMATFVDGVAASGAAVTCRRSGGGSAWYLAAHPSPRIADDVVDRLLAAARVQAPFAVPVVGVETVVRGDLRFVFNHTSAAREVRVDQELVALAPHAAEYLRAGSRGGADGSAS